MKALPPIDRTGNQLEAGSLVLVPTLPAWLTHDLPREEVAQLRLIEGKILPIAEIDRYGYVWLASADGSPWFCLRPTDVQLA